MRPTSKLLHRILPTVAIFSLLLNAGFFVHAQKEKKQLPCGSQTKAFVLESPAIEDKVRELSEQGYCIEKRHFLVIGGGKVLLLVDKNDLFTEDAEEEEEILNGK